MALRITSDCINCDVCEPACPNAAIRPGREVYEIDAGRCTECVGHFDSPRCQRVCPVDCILPDPENVESTRQLEAKYQRLTGSAR